jgi:DMSO/TMAO reductase YedYZ molybdopterin-dependent catalytic subunit
VNKRFLALLIFVIGISVIVAGVLYSQLLAPATISIVEIRDYEGQQLSSIHDFRENSILGPQNISEAEYRLLITGLVETPQTFTYQEIITTIPSYRKVITLHCVEGWSVTLLWEGIRITDLLSMVVIAPEATTAIFYAVDGYSTALPLDYLENREILLAYKMNDVTLPPERGFPFQLVAESKWGYKWIKWITSIELSNNTDYEGYWESRGFPNDADAYRLK